MSLDLSPDVESAIRERAAQQGVSVNDLLARTFVCRNGPPPNGVDSKEQVTALIAEWQALDNTPILPLIPARDGETRTQALFRKWVEEDANMTEEEQENAEKFWEEFQQGIDDERRRAGMRTLFS